jgi:hypothetical protein
MNEQEWIESFKQFGLTGQDTSAEDTLLKLFSDIVAITYRGSEGSKEQAINTALNIAEVLHAEVDLTMTRSFFDGVAEWAQLLQDRLPQLSGKQCTEIVMLRLSLLQEQARSLLYEYSTDLRGKDIDV